MNRRKAIGRIVTVGLGGGLLYSGYRWYDWHKTPDLAYLSQRRELISSLAETIIPATDTPGAGAAGTGDFIITMIKDCTDRISMNKFIEGLKDLEQYCQGKFDRPYGQCSAAEQSSVLRHFEEKGRPFKGIVGKVQDRYLGQSFFAILKKYTVEGYCSSELGATRGLAYLHIPGGYHGCLPMQPEQKVWATR